MKHRPSPRNVAIDISLVFHAALLLVLLLCYVPMARDAVSSAIANTLGLDTGQYDDSKQPIEGPLDTESAQIMDACSATIRFPLRVDTTRSHLSARRFRATPLARTILPPAT